MSETYQPARCPSCGEVKYIVVYPEGICLACLEAKEGLTDE